MPKRKADQQDPAQDATEDDELVKREAEIAQREKNLKDGEQALKKREEELERAEEEFNNEAAKAYGATKPDDVLTLNIGGTRLQVLRSTLCYVEGSLLASMFSGRWDDNLVKDDQGAFFLDHPYEHFKALIDFFRSCKLATASGPKPTIEAVSALARDQIFTRMVDHYMCTQALYPVELTIKFGKERPRNEPKVCQSPMSAEYQLHPEDSGETFFMFNFQSIGHHRQVERVSFRLEDHIAFYLGLGNNGRSLMTFDLKRNKMGVPNLQSEDGQEDVLVCLIGMNERCKRPMASSDGTKPGDTVQCEFYTDAHSLAVRFKSVKINNDLIFSATDRPEVMFNDDPTFILYESYGEFSFLIRGKACITELVLA